MLIAVGVAAVTVREVLPEIEPKVALTVVLPADRAFASPIVGMVVLIAATAEFDEAQVTCVVRFCVLLSL